MRKEMCAPIRVLHALSYSTTIQNLVASLSLEGTVQSVFSRAANLQFHRRLVTLHAPMTPCAPNGITLPAQASEYLLADLQAGMPVTIQRRTLYFPDLHVCLCLQKSQPWNPRPSLAPTPSAAHRLERSLAGLTLLLVNQGPSEGLAGLARLADSPDSQAPLNASLLMQKAWSSTRRLIQAITQQEITRATCAAQGLIGLGPGLTPSGDDLLTGLIATTVLLSETLGMSSNFYQQFGSAVLAVAEGKTTHLSFSWIEYAARGEVSEPLGRLLQALVRPDQPQQLEAIASEVLSSGATSGGDLLAGIILGSRCLLTQRAREE
jgi:hypothetical protein